MQHVHPDSCSCCHERSAATPAVIVNRPGLHAIAYRVGTHAQFKQSLLACLSSAPALRRLTARLDDDFTIGLLDAWSSMADVLTFYQERIANESYLRTATERYSVLELARLIGYELQPGVAASAYLAFTLEETTSAPQAAPGIAYGEPSGVPEVPVPPGTQVQSVPGPGEEAQVFETVEPLVGRPEWNHIKPRLTYPQAISPAMSAVVVQGTGNGLKPGDVILINQMKLRKILRVTIDETAKTTRLDLAVNSSFSLSGKPTLTTGKISPATTPSAFTGSTVKNILRYKWREGDMAAMRLTNKWPEAHMVASLNTTAAQPTKTALSGVQIFRRRAFFFGYNAPCKVSYPDRVPTFEEWKTKEDSAKIYLDAAYEELVGGVIAIQGSNENLEDIPSTRILTVGQVNIRARTAYGLSAKTTVLTMSKDWQTGIAGDSTSLSFLRDLTVYAQNEPLQIAEVPLVDPVRGDSVTLDRYYPGLKAGQRLVLIGTRTDLPGVVASELLTLRAVTMSQGLTELALAQALTHTYVRSSVALNGNVSLATHGETVQESLGSGDASKVFQRFVLRQPPLTYVSSANGSGAASTLEIRVADVLWQEVPFMLGHGPQERIYTTRVDDEGKTTVLFGDGITGARLPTGAENVKARYRKGLGLGGVVKANQLSQLLSRPLGVKGVNNPRASSGAAGREALEDARRNAPLHILTLGRIVSLQDYADFARSFAGINKALATWTWVGQRRQIVVTVAGPNGALVSSDSVLAANLAHAIRAAGDPSVAVKIAPYEPAFFQLRANVVVAPAYVPERVLAAVETALRQQFSFAARDFGQAVVRSAVIATMQQVPGVVAIDLQALNRTDEPELPAGARLALHLGASLPRSGGEGTFAAELLLLDPRPVDLHAL
ncbi:putative baseplate assembly protein [Hymenobacter sp. HD11105]